MKLKELKQLIKEELMQQLHEQEQIPKLVLLVGIPGSGKSTWINANKGKWQNTVVISPDNLRRELTGDISNQDANSNVFEVAKQKTIDALKKGINVIIDATNVDTKLRKIWIGDVTSKVDCELQAKLFWVKKEQAYDRIAKDIANKVNRSDVPNEVIDRFYILFLQSVKSLPSEGYKIIKDYVE